MCPSSGSSKDQIIFDENELLINNKEVLASNVISMISQSHQLVARFPDSLFNLPSVKRIPAGHIYHRCSSKTILRPYIYGSSASLSLHTLKTTLSSIINLYYHFYKGDIGLSYSGGLDSSCIAAQIVSNNLSIPSNLDYHGAFETFFIGSVVD